MKALTAYEDENMYGGAHTTNYKVAKKALEQGRDLIVHGSYYNGQKYSYSKFRVTNLRYANDGHSIIGDTEGEWNGRGYKIDTWYATEELCKYARTGKL